MGLNNTGSNGKYVTVADHADFDIGASAVSICGWFNAANHAQHCGIISKHNSGADTGWGVIYTTGVGVFYFQAGNGGGGWPYINASATAPPAKGTLTHFVVTRSGTSVKFYFQGVFDNERIVGANAIAVSGRNIEIGRDVNSNQHYLNGDFYDFRIYVGKVLTLAEVATIYHSKGKDGIVDSLKGRWMMNEKTAGTAAAGANSIIDVSPQGHHGTPSGNIPYISTEMSIVRF